MRTPLHACNNAHTHTHAGRQYLPGDVGFPAPPGLGEMLQDGTRLVLLDSLWHHVQNVMHHLQPNTSVLQLQNPVPLAESNCTTHCTSPSTTYAQYTSVNLAQQSIYAKLS